MHKALTNLGASIQQALEDADLSARVARSHTLKAPMVMPLP